MRTEAEQKKSTSDGINFVLSVAKNPQISDMKNARITVPTAMMWSIFVLPSAS